MPRQSHFFVSPGPEAAHEAAEYLVYHLCVRQPLDANLMEAEASTQQCRQTTARHMIFSEGFWQNMLLVQFDLINAGVLPMWLSLQRMADLWIRNVLPPQDLGLLPPSRRHAAQRAHCGAARSAVSRWLCGWWRGQRRAKRSHEYSPLPTTTTPTTTDPRSQ